MWSYMIRFPGMWTYTNSQNKQWKWCCWNALPWDMPITCLQMLSGVGMMPTMHNYVVKCLCLHRGQVAWFSCRCRCRKVFRLTVVIDHRITIKVYRASRYCQWLLSTSMQKSLIIVNKAMMLIIHCILLGCTLLVYSEASLTPQQEKELLDTHNLKRQQVDPPASYMPNMVRKSRAGTKGVLQWNPQILGCLQNP